MNSDKISLILVCIYDEKYYIMSSVTNIISDKSKNIVINKLTRKYKYMVKTNNR